MSKKTIIHINLLLFCVLTFTAFSGCSKSDAKPEEEQEQQEEEKKDDENPESRYFLQYKRDGVMVRYAAPDPLAGISGSYTIVSSNFVSYSNYARSLSITVTKSQPIEGAVLSLSINQASHIQKDDVFIPVTQISLESGRTYVDGDIAGGLCQAMLSFGKNESEAEQNLTRVEVTITELNLTEKYAKGTFTGSKVYNPKKIENGSFFVPLIISERNFDYPY